MLQRRRAFSVPTEALARASKGERDVELIRPNGMVEHLTAPVDSSNAPDAYGQAKPGRSTAEALRLAARQDRRRRSRRVPDPLRGRLFDLGV
jgi:hypothetical protein